MTAPRFDSLEGKRILLSGGKPDSIVFFDALEELLKERYPTLTIVRRASFSHAEGEKYDFDAWIEGVKTSGGGRVDNEAKFEKMGVPGATITVDDLLPQRKRVAECNGLPGIRIVTVPAETYFVCECKPEKLKPIAAAAFDDIIEALTSPLTEEEKNLQPFVYDYGPFRFEDSSYDGAYEKFQQFCAENFMTDGMPVVPPTREAVDRMLAGIAYPPDKEIGLMFPKQGRATVEKIAINAVMAGAKPEYLPVIIAMIETITAKDFNRYHIVNEILPITFISGPIVEEIGLNNEVGYLAPGHRANATIGRAMLMCMINIGWRRMDVYSSPGGLGQPDAYANYIIPENQKASPWEPYAVSNGFKPEESTVTICEGISISRGPSETLSMAGFEEKLEQMSGIFSPSAGVFGFFAMPQNGSDMWHMVAIHPTFARQLANAGFTGESFIKWLHDKNTINWDNMSEDERKEFREMVAEGRVVGIRTEDCKPGLYREPFADPKDVAVIVAGTGAGGVIVFQTPCGSTADVEDVEVTRPYMHKLIRGATLTKYGR